MSNVVTRTRQKKKIYEKSIHITDKLCKAYFYVLATKIACNKIDCDFIAYERMLSVTSALAYASATLKVLHEGDNDTLILLVYNTAMC